MGSTKGELVGHVSGEASTPGAEEVEEDNISCILKYRFRVNSIMV